MEVKYKTSQINNRRYLGNKYKLLPFITNTVNENCSDIESIADIFAGTGAVSSAFMDKTIITNDLLYSNYICNYAWFGAEKYRPEIIIELIVAYNKVNTDEDNYVSLNFADTYFSRSDCYKIGYIREHIEKSYHNGKINARERAILITSLLYAMDKIAATCGHYDAYRKSVAFTQQLELFVPLASNDNHLMNQCYNEDANNLVKRITADLVYIDPPYNSRQYCDAYHLLENIARWEKPVVHGVARKMNRTGLKSRYCTMDATVALETLINDIHAKYILFSYNNMSSKCNARSNAKISDSDIIRIFSSKGDLSVFSTNHKAFSAGKSNITDNSERLFLCKCFDEV